MKMTKLTTALFTLGLALCLRAEPIEFKQWKPALYTPEDKRGSFKVSEIRPSEDKADGDGCWTVDFSGEPGAEYSSLGINGEVLSPVEAAGAKALVFSVKTIVKEASRMPVCTLEISSLSGKEGGTLQLGAVTLKNEDEWREVEVPITKSAEDLAALGSVKSVTLLFPLKGYPQTDLTLKIKGVHLKK